MRKKLKCILLIDDNSDDNFFHERVINKCHAAEVVVAKQTSMDALKFLKSNQANHKMHPNLIFLDINMPGMNGLEFLYQYNSLEAKFKSHAFIVILTNSENPDDKMKVEEMNIACDFKTKPLTQEMLEAVMDKYFKNV